MPTVGDYDDDDNDDNDQSDLNCQFKIIFNLKDYSHQTDCGLFFLDIWSSRSTLHIQLFRIRSPPGIPFIGL